MDIKRVNHIELHFNHKDDLETLLFMNNDCEIVIRNLKQDHIIVGGEAVNNYTYDFMSLWFKTDDDDYYNHNYESLKKLKTIKLDDLCSIVIKYTDGTELMIYPTKDITYVAMNNENEYLHVMYQK